MKIAFHIGLHSTDEDLLLSGLRDNAALLEAINVCVPPGPTYRPLLRETVLKLKGEPASPATETAVLEQILKGKDCKRLVLSNENFICTAQRVFEDGVLYGKIVPKAQWLRQVFPSHEVSFHVGLRSPASLIPALFARQKPKPDFSAFLDQIDLAGLRWRAVIQRLRQHVTDCDITVWCNEDTPLIWPEVLCAVAGLPPNTALENAHVRLKEIITDEGMSRYLEYLECHPTISIEQRRWAAISFLDRYSDEASLQETYDLPDWTQERISALDAAYDLDLEAISDIPNVTVLRP